MFYFQAKVKQSVLFLLPSTFSSYYGAKHETSRTDRPTIRESMCPTGCPENTRPDCAPGTSGMNPSLSYPRCPIPCPNYDSKPPPLSPRLCAVQGPPNPKITMTVGLERVRTHDKRVTSLSSAHTQVCARDNISMTCLESYAMNGP